MSFTATGAQTCTNHMYCGLEGNKETQNSDPKCSIVELWFLVNANFSVKYICTQNINYESRKPAQ
jgi:hypothetical protein